MEDKNQKEDNKNPFYKKWWFWVGIILVIGFIGGASEEPSENQTNEEQVVSNEENEEEVEVPDYTVLDKTEHISTKQDQDEAVYFGDVLIEKDIEEIKKPEEFSEIAEIIVEEENLKESATFYTTKEAYEANWDSAIEGAQEALDNGYIGSFKDGELDTSTSSKYFKLHNNSSNDAEDDSNEENTSSTNNLKASMTGGGNDKDVSSNSEDSELDEKNKTSEKINENDSKETEESEEKDNNELEDESNEEEVVEYESDGSDWYVSSHWSSEYYYCEESDQWKDLSEKYLEKYSSEEELKDNYPDHKLHESCY